MEFTKTFNQIDKCDAAIAGGKGASLGEMTQSGLPVPPGFVILADGFTNFLEANQLYAGIAAELTRVNIHDTNSVERASETIRAMIDATPIPGELGMAIEKDHSQLNTKFVAVRSSATAEDSSTASWAGELESYLYTTQENLLGNVKKCWSSLYTPRAIFYRTEKGMANTFVAVAVVIQTMVAAEVSGICFTVHPVTKDTNQLIIEAGWGLGEAIVGGMITPDSYVLDKTSWNILDTYIAEQSIKIIQDPRGGTHEVAVAAHDQERQKLSNEHVVELAKLCKKIEDHYGWPQDIEWALADGTLWVLQSRPITTL